jgi:predicted ATPase/class 3 adenylate cyclase
VLRALRETRGVTQDGWAASLGFSRASVQRWERGDAVPDAAAEAAILTVCRERGLFRTIGQGPLQGLSITAEFLIDLLGQARLGIVASPEDSANAGAAGARAHVHLGPADAALSEFAPAETQPTQPAMQPTGTVTFLFTDIEGSTTLWQRHSTAMETALARHDAMLRTAITANGGHVFKTVGDAFCAAFAAAPDALAAAIAAQHALAAEPWPETGPLHVRMALHTGAAQLRDGDYFGPTINRVARVLAAGHGGQVLLSLATAQLVRELLPTDVTLLDLGEHHLRDLVQPERIFQVLHPDLPTVFPPLRAGVRPPTNLSAAFSSFVGREQEMSHVRQLLTGARLLTLTGAGGIGKTRLALETAAELVDQYPDGVWLVELAALTDPFFVPQAVATALTIREQPDSSLTATITDHLRPRTMLLLLDNCEHLVAACASLVETLLRSCPSVSVLATSREPLGITGESRYRVPPLGLPSAASARLRGLGDGTHSASTDLPNTQYRLSDTQSEAVRLFVQRAQAVQPAFALTDANMTAVAQICRRLDGMPLALELAAARTSVLTVDQIAARLDDRFRLLTGGSRTALPRQQTLRALIDWSYALLAPAEQALLARLSVFAGGFSLDAAEAVCGTDDDATWDTLDLLGNLVDKSLVLSDTQGKAPRYRLLTTIREFAAGQLATASDSAALRSRHYGWYLALAERADGAVQGPDQQFWLEQLDLEHDNLRAAVQWAAENGDPPAELRLAAALWRFWEIHGHLSEGRARLEHALTRPGGDTLPVAVKALHGAGALARKQGDYERACALFEKELTRARHISDTRGIAAALTSLGTIAKDRGDYQHATELFEEGVARFRELNDAAGIAASLTTLGNLARAQGDRDRAVALLGESLAVRQSMQDRRGSAIVLNNLGVVAEDQGDIDQAASFYRESLAILQALGDKSGTAVTVSNLAAIAARRGDCEGAAQYYRDALLLRDELGDRPGIATCLEGMALLAQVQHLPDRAARLLGAAAALRESIGVALSPGDQAQYDRVLADARRDRDASAFDADWMTGRAMSVEDVVGYALKEGVSSATVIE